MSNDYDDLMPVFVEECREHVEVLNLALLTIERNPNDPDAIQDAFRAAHSLKGMSATMGFTRMAQLTHAMESIIDAIKIRAGYADPVVVTALLTASDALLRLTAEIESGGTELFDVADLVANLDSMMKNSATPEAEVQLSDVALPSADLCLEYESSGLLIYELELRISTRSLMPSARAFASLLALDQVSTVISSQPSRDDLELGLFDGRRVLCWIATDRMMEDVQHVAQTQEIESAEVRLFKPEISAAGEERIPENFSLQRARTVRIDASRLDDLMHGVGELLVQRSRVQNIVHTINDRELADAIDSLDRVARTLQELVMDVRMVSIDTIFRRLPRLVRDLSHKLGKEVRLNLSGQDTELDRTVIDVLGDPLVHIVRNAIDHGIETPTQRVERGKSATGLLDISASTEGGAVVIRIRDDGAGMQPDRIRESAVNKGVISDADSQKMDDDQIIDLCFAPGFSTRNKTNDVSGRGVGLDVVRGSVRALGGDIVVESSDEGTNMTIRLPLTLAIRSVLLFTSGTDTYAFHTDRIAQTVDLEHYEVQSLAGTPAIVHLEQIVPLVQLGDLLNGEVAAHGTHQKVVILDDGKRVVGAVVDDVLGQAEVVTRALPTAVRASSLLASSVVLGDGEVAFLINTEKLIETVEKGGSLSVNSR